MIYYTYIAATVYIYICIYIYIHVYIHICICITIYYICNPNLVLLRLSLAEGCAKPSSPTGDKPNLRMA